jgi:hypothetical protein
MVFMNETQKFLQKTYTMEIVHCKPPSQQLLTCRVVENFSLRVASRIFILCYGGSPKMIRYEKIFRPPHGQEFVFVKKLSHGNKLK